MQKNQKYKHPKHLPTQTESERKKESFKSNRPKPLIV